ncbi:MAG TPA: hypothetical protein VK669_00800, partial [Candidatus Limnocylindrales bacterium]|nr:hypothetical protein [Candidatus Limnocylindrales bacterium]
MVRIDAESGALCAGEDRRPVVLDLDAATATIELEDGPATVRALRWREKLALARFAALGPRFVEAQFLRATAGRDVADAEARALLLALARWLNAPEDADALPFDPHELARAEIGVCTAMALRPADLDARPAFEIELLWQTIRGAAPGASPARRAEAPTDDWTRIVVVPDPVEPVVAATADDAREATAPDAAPPIAPARAPAPAPAPKPAGSTTDDGAASGPPPGETAETRSTTQHRARAVRRASIGSDVMRVDGGAAKPMPFVFSRTTARLGAEIVPRVPPAPPATANATGFASSADGESPAPHDRPTTAGVSDGTTPPTAPNATTPSVASNRTGQPVAQRSEVAREIGAADRVAVFGRAEATAADVPAARAMRSNGAVHRHATGPHDGYREPGAFGAMHREGDPPDHDVDALVAVLSERFEEAAAEIGIAPW